MKKLSKSNWLTLSVVMLSIIAVAGCSKDAENEKASTETTAAAAPRAAVVNATCPIMGNAIDPSKVPDSLYRTYKKQGVGFCCGGCPAAWDALSDSDKASKLAKSMPK
jgi:hypothetical protein